MLPLSMCCGGGGNVTYVKGINASGTKSINRETRMAGSIVTQSFEEKRST